MLILLEMHRTKKILSISIQLWMITLILTMLVHLEFFSTIVHFLLSEINVNSFSFNSSPSFARNKVPIQNTEVFDDIQTDEGTD